MEKHSYGRRDVLRMMTTAGAGVFVRVSMAFASDPAYDPAATFEIKVSARIPTGG